jgi:predicted GNAT family acetyltransferase
VRENPFCAEVAVETLPEFQRRGYARRVCAAWANNALRRGKVAFFSHAESNLASRRLALSLGVVEYAACISYE